MAPEIDRLERALAPYRFAIYSPMGGDPWEIALHEATGRPVYRSSAESAARTTSVHGDTLPEAIDAAIAAWGRP